MKKILLLLSLLIAFSCAEPYNFNPNEEVIDSEYVDPFLGCYSVQSTGTNSSTRCERGDYMILIRYEDIDRLGTYQVTRYLICLNSRYTINDIRLGQIICDLDQYQ